jgi:hypothetical protein
MHDIDIPRWVVDRVIKRRGAEHLFTDLDPGRTARRGVGRLVHLLPVVHPGERRTSQQRAGEGYGGTSDLEGTRRRRRSP